MTKEFNIYWSVLLASVVVLCLSCHFFVVTSGWFLILILLSLSWVVELTIFTYKFSKIVDKKSSLKISRNLYFSATIFLVAGFLNALLCIKNAFMSSTIGLFCFISCVLSLYFAIIIKYKKTDETEWQKTPTVSIGVFNYNKMA